jgi:glucose-6-phosphate isomerase
MEKRGNQFSMRDAYPNVTGTPSTFEFTTPEKAEQASHYDADSNPETIADMRGAANRYSVWVAVGMLLAVVVVGGMFGR